MRIPLKCDDCTDRGHCPERISGGVCIADREKPKEAKMMDKPKIMFDSRGESGNIYWILGKVQLVMKKQRRYTEFNELRDRVFEAKSYAEALSIIREKVDLVDVSAEA